MAPTSLTPRTCSSSSSSSSVRSNPSKLPSSTTPSLSAIVSNLFQRTSLHRINAAPPTETDPYSDKTIASLLLAEASRPTSNRSRSGTRAELEKEAIRRPNKRFLKGVLGHVEAHNRAVIRAQRHRFESSGSGPDRRTRERRSGEEVDEDEEDDNEEQERRHRRSRQEKETDRDRLRERDRPRHKPRHRDRDRDGDPGDEGRHRSSRRSEDDHDKARSDGRRDDDDTNHRTSKQRDEHREHRHRRIKDEHQDRHRERSDKHRPREDDKDRSSTKTASNDAGPIAHTTAGVPSKMDKYFAPDYDPLFDVSVENDLTDPTTRLIAPGAFDEWDTMLKTIKEKEERKREEKEGRRRRKERDKEGRRRERRRRRGESVSSSDEGAGGEHEGRQGKKIKVGEGKGLMEVEYTRVGGTREWDRGKEHLS
ncbi:BZ3500_MvSof-1268-A1-R1_Chr4-1g06688 [Microbotryum saponariae]|uniref:BZ3500_MvSof-1268-A1-R1_Chr4-1g06688 protein n=1 Tax=Microbotryum saponariae TaxID=289078 RepID=A0A2X0M330_9BASI|nr:BZ3500_MvSof-1268-A1-R1_Chr4-1g06688 [Microbotryum saponariae]SDA06353.1 BZ3501_MvSof-1269-A2-R1_Chr4-1g06398 [Microbotryum saponariae]